MEEMKVITLRREKGGGERGGKKRERETIEVPEQLDWHHAEAHESHKHDRCQTERVVNKTQSYVQGQHVSACKVSDSSSVGCSVPGSVKKKTPTLCATPYWRWFGFVQSHWLLQP